MDRGAWWAKAHGVLKSQTRLSEKTAMTATPRIGYGTYTLWSSVAYSETTTSWCPEYWNSFWYTIYFFASRSQLETSLKGKLTWDLVHFICLYTLYSLKVEPLRLTQGITTHVFIQPINSFIERYYVCLGQDKNHSYHELKMDICSCISKQQLTNVFFSFTIIHYYIAVA